MLRRWDYVVSPEKGQRAIASFGPLPLANASRPVFFITNKYVIINLLTNTFYPYGILRLHCKYLSWITPYSVVV